MPNVEIVIKTITQGDDNTRRSIGSLTELNSAIGLVRQGLEVAQKVYSETAGKALEYANQVRQLSMISGESAEETSRFIQVLDDYKIGADEALTATRALTKNGLTPSIDTIATLSDQYLKLNSAEERNAFVIKNLGRAGLQWTEVLNKGSTAIKAQGAAISANLILNQKQLDAARANEIAMDNLNDAWDGFTITAGNKMVPALTGVINEINSTNRAIEIMKEQGLSGGEIFLHMVNNTEVYIEALRQANTEQEASTAAMLANAEAADQNEISMKEQEAAIRAVSESNTAFLGVLGQVDSAMDAYREGVAASYAELQAGNIKVDEHKAKVAELAAQYEEAKNQIVLSIVEMKLASDGWTNAEVNAYLQIGQQLGAFSEDTVQETRRIVASADKLVAGFEAMGEQTMHTGERALDAAEDFGLMGDAASEMGEEINSTATPAVGGLKSQLNGLPPNNSAWQYSFIINVRGRVPSLPDIASQTEDADHFNYHNDMGGMGAAYKPTMIGTGAQPEMFVPQSAGTFAPADQWAGGADKIITAIAANRTNPKEIARYVVEGLVQAGVV